MHLESVKSEELSSRISTTYLDICFNHLSGVGPFIIKLHVLNGVTLAEWRLSSCRYYAVIVTIVGRNS